MRSSEVSVDTFALQCPPLRAVAPEQRWRASRTSRDDDGGGEVEGLLLRLCCCCCCCSSLWPSRMWYAVVIPAMPDPMMRMSHSGGRSGVERRLLSSWGSLSQ